MDILEGINNMAKRLGGAFSPLENIILNSRYVVLTFAGFSTGVVNLTHLFDDNVFRNKRLLIKSVRLIPFALNDNTDELFNATTGDHFVINENARITKCVDEFTSLGHINIIINGTNVNLFPSSASGGQVLDLFVDNIYYNYKARVQNIDVNILGEIVENFETQATASVKIKVIIEGYSY